jgi:predicted nucleic acid-binding protein
MPCLDTSILVDILRNEERTLEKVAALEKQQTRLSTTVISAYELMKGARLSSRPRKNMKTVKGLLDDLIILELDPICAEMASEAYRGLKDRGTPIGEFDILIAATCMANDETLISTDGDFRKIRGLKFQKY